MRIVIQHAGLIPDVVYELEKLLNATNKSITVDITPGDIRSYSQNNLFQDATRYLAKSIAEKMEIEFTFEIHDWIKHRTQRRWGITREFYNKTTKETDRVLISTTKYTKGEMTHMITQLLAYCAEIGVDVPSKGEYADLMEAQNA